MEEGVETKGIYFKTLRYDDLQKRPPTFILKFDAGSSYPFHNHPAGEEAFVLIGEVYFNETKLSKEYGFPHPNQSRTQKTQHPTIKTI